MLSSRWTLLEEQDPNVSEGMEICAPEESGGGVVKTVPHDSFAVIVDCQPALHSAHTEFDVLERRLHHSHGNSMNHEPQNKSIILHTFDLLGDELPASWRSQDPMHQSIPTDTANMRVSEYHI